MQIQTSFFDSTKDTSAAEHTEVRIKPLGWSFLLRDISELNIKSMHFTPIPAAGCTPEAREIDEYIRHGVVNVDKPSNPSSHE